MFLYTAAECCCLEFQRFGGNSWRTMNAMNAVHEALRKALAWSDPVQFRRSAADKERSAQTVTIDHLSLAQAVDVINSTVVAP
jgi:hypothetical protein